CVARRETGSMIGDSSPARAIRRGGATVVRRPGGGPASTAPAIVPDPGASPRSRNRGWGRRGGNTPPGVGRGLLTRGPGHGIVRRRAPDRGGRERGSDAGEAVGGGAPRLRDGDGAAGALLQLCERAGRLRPFPP